MTFSEGKNERVHEGTWFQKVRPPHRCVELKIGSKKHPKTTVPLCRIALFSILKFFGGKNVKARSGTAVFGRFFEAKMKRYTAARCFLEVKPPYRRVELIVCSKNNSQKHRALVETQSIPCFI